MPLIIKSLDAVNVAGPGTVFSFNLPPQDIVLIASTTGSATDFSIALEGSFDGEIWRTLASSTGGDAILSIGVVTFFARANVSFDSPSEDFTVTATIAIRP